MKSSLDFALKGRRGERRPARQFDGPQEGIVRSVGPKGIRFILPDYDEKYVFGPAPWTKSAVEPAGAHSHSETGTGGGTTSTAPDHDHNPTDPPVGARCLVVFVGNGIGRPWVIGWWA